jgi:16S rRNA (uracil1498-N3)-methyltransferase
MTAPWFFVDALPAAGLAWMLSREEAKHATGSKRLAPGDAVVLFDGRGRIARALLGSHAGAERGRDGAMPVVVERLETVERSDAAGRRVHLASALPKGDRLATLVDMTTQLAVASFTPLRCERSVVAESEHRAERMRRIQIEACKQARCAWLPELRPEATPATIARVAPQGSLLVADPSGEPIAGFRATLPAEVTVCIGPEGGFTPSEVDAFRAAGATFVSLGATILRTETAAVVALAELR